MCLALSTFPSSRKTKLTKLHSLAYESTLLHPPSVGDKKKIYLPATLCSCIIIIIIIITVSYSDMATAKSRFKKKGEGIGGYGILLAPPDTFCE